MSSTCRTGSPARYCCLLFRYLGAEVVRVDQPDGRAPTTTLVAGYLDAGKKSITLDASQPEGAGLLLRLAERADVLVTDHVLPAGLDYATLSRQNPRLVLTRVAEPPSNGDGRFWEYFTGLNAFAATLLPLVNMAILGRGQQVEVDGAECVAAAAFVVDGPGQWPQVRRRRGFSAGTVQGGRAGAGPAPARRRSPASTTTRSTAACSASAARRWRGSKRNRLSEVG